MVETGDGLGLGLKALGLLRRRQGTGLQHLQGDDALQAFLAGAVDDAHAPPSDLVEQLVIAEHGAGGQRRRGRRDGSQRSGQALDVVLIGEESGQLARQLGMTVQQGLPRGGLA